MKWIIARAAVAGLAGAGMVWTCALLASAKPDPGAHVASVDLRPMFKSRGLEVGSQGKRGTCSAFAVTGALEYALASQRRCGLRLSVEFLNWASNQAIGQAKDGGFFSDLWKGYEAYGICTEEECPYRAAFDPRWRPSAEVIGRARERRNIGLRLHWIKPWDVKTGLTESQFLDIKQTLRRQQPVCAGLRWPKREQWAGGVLKMAPPEGVFDGHSVLLVGFRDDDAQPGGGVFLLRNSGKGPRDGAMSYEYARAYMNDAARIDHETSEAKPSSEQGRQPDRAPASSNAAQNEIKPNLRVLQGLDALVASPGRPSSPARATGHLLLRLGLDHFRPAG